MKDLDKKMKSLYKTIMEKIQNMNNPQKIVLKYFAMLIRCLEVLIKSKKNF